VLRKERPTVAEVMPLVNAYYQFAGCNVGGCLHIVLDDDNIEDDSIEYCIECALDPDFWVSRDHWDGHDEAGELLGQLLLLMSMTQRGKLATQHDGYGQGHAMDRAEFIARCRALLGKYQSADAVDPHAGDTPA
jgi:hypothetical protein